MSEGSASHYVHCRCLCRGGCVSRSKQLNQSAITTSKNHPRGFSTGAQQMSRLGSAAGKQARRHMGNNGAASSASGAPPGPGPGRIQDYGPYLSDASLRRRPSPIRKLAALSAREGMVSLGGGMPNPTLFPFRGLKFGVVADGGDGGGGEGGDGETVTELELTEGEVREALQYSPTPGLLGLLSHLGELQRREHGGGRGDEDAGELDWDVQVTVGSQDGLTKAFEMLLNPGDGLGCDGDGDGDEVFVESPTYTGALAFLRPYGVTIRPVATDAGGLIPDALADALEASSSPHPPSGARRRRRVLYTIPTAQNPTGCTLLGERRTELYDLARRHDLIILEDDPYYFLHPDRHSTPSFLSIDVDGRVLRFDSTSKLLSSGMRIGFVTGPAPLVGRLGLHVQATNLHASGLSQMVTAKLLDHWGPRGFDDHAVRVAEFYRRRGDVAVAAAERHLTGLAEWDVPEAGMFLWMRLLNGITDTKSLIEEKAAKANVLFVPGQAFCPLDRPSPYVRASFSTASDEDMDVAMERLAAIIREEGGSTDVGDDK